MLFQDILVAKARNGRGLFANKDIARGEKVLQFEGKIINWVQAKVLGHENHVVPVGLDKYVDVSEPESLINHSCHANTGFFDNKTLFALRDIKKGDELTFDYSLVTVDGWTMDCNCGSKNCRRLVGNFKDLHKSLRDNYKEHTPKWVLEVTNN